MSNVINLSWLDINQTENGYRVYRDTSPLDINNLPAPYADLGADSEEFVDEDVTFGDIYYYVVSAYNDTEEAFSNNITVQCREAIFVSTDRYGMYSVSIDGTTMKTGTIKAATNGQDRIFTTSYSKPEFSDCDREGNQFFVSYDDQYLYKVDSDFNFVWEFNLGSNYGGNIQNLRCDLLGNVYVALFLNRHVYVAIFDNETGSVLSYSDVTVAIAGTSSYRYLADSGLNTCHIIPTKNPNITIVALRWRDDDYDYWAGTAILSSQSGIIGKNLIIKRDGVESSTQTGSRNYTLEAGETNNTTVLSNGKIIFAGSREWALINEQGIIEVYNNQPVSGGDYNSTVSVVQTPDGSVWGIAGDTIQQINSSTLSGMNSSQSLSSATDWPVFNNNNSGRFNSVASDYDGNIYFAMYYNDDDGQYHLIKYDPINHEVLWDKTYTRRIHNINILPGRIYQDLGKH